MSIRFLFRFPELVLSGVLVSGIILLSACECKSQQTRQKSGKQPSDGIKRERLVLHNYEHVSAELDIVYADYGERKMHLDLYSPKNIEGTAPCVVVVHGGGWLKGDRIKFRPMAEAFAARGYVAAAVEYRLGGEAKFPAGVQDCIGAVKFLRANAARYKIDPNKIGAVGGSAGGHIVGLLAAASDESEFSHAAQADARGSVQAAIVLSGPMDLLEGPVAKRSRENPQQSNANKWIGRTVDQAPDVYALASPIRHFSKTTSPILFAVGELENGLNFVPAQQKLRELRISSAIRVYAAGKHGCWNQNPWFSIMMEDMDRFLAESMDAKPFARLAIESRPWGGVQRVGNELVLNVKNPGGLRSGVHTPVFHSRIGKIVVENKPELEVVCTPAPKSWNFKVAKDADPGDQPLQIRVEMLDEPTVRELPRIVSQSANGTISLPAHYSIPSGEFILFEPQPHKNTVGWWTNPEDSVSWKFFVERPGKYRVRILQGCGEGEGGSKAEISIDEQKLLHTVVDTGHFQNFQWLEPGELQLDAGVRRLKVRIAELANHAAMDVRLIELVPIGQSSTAGDSGADARAR